MSDERESTIGGEATLVADSLTPGSLGAGDRSTGSWPSAVLCDRWEILGMIGAGGMGVVYRARDRELDQIVALKMMHGDAATDDAIERLRREVKLSLRVTDRHVARVYELREHEGKRFFTMEYVDGESLRVHIDRIGPLSPARSIQIAIAIARGLAAVHEVGVVHRDLKPDNVLMGRDGRIALTDFGIASSTIPGEHVAQAGLAGTPSYMAPEQVDGSRPIDARTDLYALGCVLFELLTGEPPFGGPTPLAVAAARLARAAPDPRSLRGDVPAPLADLVLACLERDPEKRPQSAPALIDTLVSMATGGPLPTVAPPAPSPSETAVSLVQRTRMTRLAVLPVASPAGERDHLLADGFTGDLIDGLSGMRDVQVLSRSMVARFRAGEIDPREVGRELGADAVVEGSLRRVAEGRMRLTLRLIGTADGLQLWSSRRDVADGDLLAASDEAAGSIAGALTAAIAPAAKRTRDPAAVELYLRGRAAHREFSLDGAERAVAFFADALAKAPDDPLLVSGYATALARRSFFRADGAADALDAARRATALAPESGEAHLAMSVALIQRDDAAQSLRYALDAVALAPSLAEAHQVVGRVLAETGPLDLASRFLSRATELDAVSPTSRVELARVCALLGETDRARAHLDEALRLTAQGSISGLFARMRFGAWFGDDEQRVATAQMRDALATLNSSLPGARLLLLLATAFDDAAPLPDPETIEAAVQPGASRRDAFLLQMFIEKSCQRGDLVLARRLLARSVGAGLYDVCWLEHCPLLAALREDPEAAKLLAEVAARAAAIRAVLPKPS